MPTKSWSYETVCYHPSIMRPPKYPQLRRFVFKMTYLLFLSASCNPAVIVRLVTNLLKTLELIYSPMVSKRAVDRFKTIRDLAGNCGKTGPSADETYRAIK